MKNNYNGVIIYAATSTLIQGKKICIKNLGSMHKKSGVMLGVTRHVKKVQKHKTFLLQPTCREI